MGRVTPRRSEAGWLSRNRKEGERGSWEAVEVVRQLVVIVDLKCVEYGRTCLARNSKTLSALRNAQ